MSDVRSLPVPDGLEGERVDAALARLFGLSRSRAAEIAAAGDVTVDGAPAGKSDRLHAGSWLEVTLPPPPGTPPRCRSASPTACRPPR
ncbi:S4 domain-containing protein, partial [Actinomadura kijaniata]|uniref:S4 domain-containing protein n=1 Tax=Actinomadura kijaniata TaxID=46161 RepID=UPI003F1BEC2C